MLSILMRSARRVRAEYGLKKAKQLVTGAVRYFPYSFRWLGYVHDLYERHLGAEPPIELVRTRFLRPYHSKRLSPASRLRLLTGHYGALEVCFRAPVIATILRGTAMALGTVSGRDGGTYRLELYRHDRYRYEGELTLFLIEDASDTVLAALTFNLGLSPHHDVQLRIAALQGPAGEDAKTQVVRVTRNLWGTRPKALALDAIYALAGLLMCRDIEAVQTRNHPLSDTNHRLVADNDGFWSEIATSRTRHGDFVLPAVMPVRTLDEVPAKKRKDWLARQALKQDLKRQVQTAAGKWLRDAIRAEDDETRLDIAAE